MVSALVPKLRLGTRSAFAKLPSQVRETEFRDGAFPNRVWERGGRRERGVKADTRIPPWSPCHPVILALLLLVFGCGGGTPATRSAGTEGKPPADDPLEVERDVFRKATDAASLRDALQVVNSHLTDSSGLREIKARRDQELPPERLRELLSLQPEELDYLQAATFLPLDAHYLVEALELHEAARGLQIDGLPPLQQAERAFQWVMRQLVLSGDRAEWVPPHYVLQGGQGSAQDRALVFLALLQQFGIEGCMLAIPGEGQNQPRVWAVGALLEDKSRNDIYLFDTRLGLPLPGPEGKGIVTLAQLKAQPELLRPLRADKDRPYDITPEQVRTAAVYLGTSLSAFAPRMKFLEDRLPSSGVRLSVDPGRLVTRLEKAAQSKICPWPGPGKQTGLPPSTPVRALRRFVPQQDGGLDRTGVKAQRYEQRLLPLATVSTALRELRLEDLPQSATQRLYEYAGILYLNYVSGPHENLVRGRLDETTRTLVQILSILREFDEARMPETEFQEKVVAWRERVKQAQIQVIRQVPDADKALESIWIEDQHLHMLLAQAVDDRDRGKLMGQGERNREHEKPQRKILSFLVMRTVATPLHHDASYLLALCWQEKAERVQAQRLRHAALHALPKGGEQPARTGKDEDQANAWLNVQDWWQKYVNQYPFSPASINARVKALANLQIRPDASLGEVLERVDKFVSQWQWFCRDLRFVFQARLLQAHGLEKAGKKDAARAGLQSLLADLDALRRDNHLSQAVDAAVKRTVALRSAVARAGGPESLFADMQTRLTDLQRDLAPGGSFTWMRATVVYRLRQLQ